MARYVALALNALRKRLERAIRSTAEVRNAVMPAIGDIEILTIATDTQLGAMAFCVDVLGQGGERLLQLECTIGCDRTSAELVGQFVDEVCPLALRVENDVARAASGGRTKSSSGIGFKLPSSALKL